MDGKRAVILKCQNEFPLFPLAFEPFFGGPEFTVASLLQDMNTLIVRIDPAPFEVGPGPLNEFFVGPGLPKDFFKGKNVEQETANYEHAFANPLQAAKRGYVDDIVMPSRTRVLMIASAVTCASYGRKTRASSQRNRLLIRPASA